MDGNETTPAVDAVVVDAPAVDLIGEEIVPVDTTVETTVPEAGEATAPAAVAETI